jgi:hypothetical protein
MLLYHMAMSSILHYYTSVYEYHYKIFYIKIAIFLLFQLLDYSHPTTGYLKLRSTNFYEFSRFTDVTWNQCRLNTLRLIAVYKQNFEYQYFKHRFNKSYFPYHMFPKINGDYSKSNSVYM